MVPFRGNLPCCAIYSESIILKKWASKSVASSTDSPAEPWEHFQPQLSPCRELSSRMGNGDAMDRPVAVKLSALNGTGKGAVVRLFGCSQALDPPSIVHM